MSLGIGAVMPPKLTEADILGYVGGAVWVTPRRSTCPDPPSGPRRPGDRRPDYSRPTNVSNVASGGHANRTGV
ncbi:hypothetical protein GCM10010384_29470 [Streptomyces djakartensis]|uniref:Uncharacterized protein n=1 Tax=Streptomyces djakartensis TaxID=68193 RepID=A0ABQ2ZN15_9ACTN|nr:hypothetical protein GCM10010384_29470 [Streptomyces djakartensis]